MKAQVTCYKPGAFGVVPEPETDTKTVLELFQFLLRAGRRDYTAMPDYKTGEIYLFSTRNGNDFAIRFIEEE